MVKLYNNTFICCLLVSFPNFYNFESNWVMNRGKKPGFSLINEHLHPFPSRVTIYILHWNFFKKLCN